MVQTKHTVKAKWLFSKVKKWNIPWSPDPKWAELTFHQLNTKLKVERPKYKQLNTTLAKVSNGIKIAESHSMLMFMGFKPSEFRQHINKNDQCIYDDTDLFK